MSLARRQLREQRTLSFSLTSEKEDVENHLTQARLLISSMEKEQSKKDKAFSDE